MKEWMFIAGTSSIYDLNWEELVDGYCIWRGLGPVFIVIHWCGKKAFECLKFEWKQNFGCLFLGAYD